MNLPDLIHLMSTPAAYPYPVSHVEVRQTHVSVVFLAGPFVFKVKKPVDLGFLDFRDLKHRRYYCAEEVRLNRRLAPDVYLGVAPITNQGVGERVEYRTVVEWAVKMVRLADEDSFQAHLRRGDLSPSLVGTLAERLARFHQEAEGGPEVASFGRAAVVAETILQNFDQARDFVGQTVTPDLFRRLQRRTGEVLATRSRLVEARATRGTIREGHGDLRLEHVFHLADHDPPHDLVVIDCIEFSRALRCVDPVADVAFLVMDLLNEGHADLADLFARVWFEAMEDDEGWSLLPLYAAYRATVRAKVESMKQAEPEVSPAEREAARCRATRYWSLALAILDDPEALFRHETNAASPLVVVTPG